MTTIFNLGDDDVDEKINIDELYDSKQKRDLDTLQLFQKILGRIHQRIKTASRQKGNEQFCTYLVPEVMIGIPRYDHGECIAYLVNKLRENGFNVKYIHPNLLFIAWNHWIPSYVRTEIKKKTGMIVDGKGNVTDKGKDKDKLTDNPLDNILFERSDNKAKSQDKDKGYKSIDSYKPVGNLVYNQEMFRKLNEKLN